MEIREAIKTRINSIQTDSSPQLSKDAIAAIWFFDAQIVLSRKRVVFRVALRCWLMANSVFTFS